MSCELIMYSLDFCELGPDRKLLSIGAKLVNMKLYQKHVLILIVPHHHCCSYQVLDISEIDLILQI